ncbi:uncharacterized protein LY79DRAFT_223074 [Colletotrichum navitas]|uniref:Uncharacterized protein n=1 Tax=Colletotrichum navitas TaxID=681940 RepID=A0AAD8V4C0_9PEZI|nr:uncharacterized protein LY79DRAFT_223074 [Colletotrichum navitas]KAK1590146.1 hypothetical protein LY79DRAFT_223074 [Colletotrichum navitas]
MWKDGRSWLTCLFTAGLGVTKFNNHCPRLPDAIRCDPIQCVTMSGSFRTIPCGGFRKLLLRGSAKAQGGGGGENHPPTKLLGGERKLACHFVPSSEAILDPRRTYCQVTDTRHPTRGSKGTTYSCSAKRLTDLDGTRTHVLSRLVFSSYTLFLYSSTLFPPLLFPCKLVLASSSNPVTSSSFIIHLPCQGEVIPP